MRKNRRGRETLRDEKEKEMNDLIRTKQSILALIHEAEEIIYQCGKKLDEMDDYLAEFLAANGVIVPPCKVGDQVWFIRNGKIIETTVDKIVLKHRGLHLKLSCNSMYETSCNSIGKTVFLSREEAEAVLKGASDGQRKAD
jgi:hypothetical protein